MAEDATAFWLHNAGRYPLLTPAAEVSLGNCVRAWMDWPGGPDAAPPKVARAGRRAHTKMVNCNLRLVSAVVKKYLHHCQRTASFSHADLLQMGSIGLLRAVDKFDPSCGYKFSTYAYWWIRQAVGRNSMNTSCVYVPSTQLEFARRWRYRDKDVTIEEFAKQEKKSVEWCWKMLQMVDSALSIGSIDKQLKEGDDGGTVGDFIQSDEADPMDEMDYEIALSALQEAYPTEMEALKMRLIDGAKPLEIANALLGHNSPRRAKDFLYNAKPRLELVAKNVDADLLLST
jgi:RNA polymerase primary sigma factor